MSSSNKVDEQKVPYTKNTKEIRKFLEEHEYYPLRFFQGGEYIYPIVSTMANAKSTWEVKDYSTFNENKKSGMPYLIDSPLSEEQFKSYIINPHTMTNTNQQEQLYRLTL